MIIVWHQQDLRLEDNPALCEALKASDQVCPVFILPPSQGRNAPGRASSWWLHESLKSLQKDYQKKGGKLVIKKGDPAKVIPLLAKKLKAKGVYWNERFELDGVQNQKKVAAALKKLGLEGRSFNGNYLIHLPEFFNQSKKPYTVFSPFWRAAQKEIKAVKLHKIRGKIRSPQVASDSFSSLMPKGSFHWGEFWVPGRAGAEKQLKSFKAQGLRSYESYRDLPELDGTSCLSPHLHFGEISPQEIWLACSQSQGKGKQAFLRQMGWREFATYFIYHFPKSPGQNWNQKFNRFAWKASPAQLKKWQQGNTGYPIVDAAMRELEERGWILNRLRMIVASFLIKDLLIDWRKGAAWFWDTLVDADLANNTLGWQWVAGSGPDPAPFFRIFNPILQAKKFDPNGNYVRELVPELAKLPNKWIHEPWNAPDDVLEKAKVKLGRDYPKPVVEHEEARAEALKRYKKL